jgi:hypothetical protein
MHSRRLAEPGRFLIASAGTSYFNGFPPAKVVHVNQDATVTG